MFSVQERTTNRKMKVWNKDGSYVEPDQKVYAVVRDKDGREFHFAYVHKESAERVAGKFNRSPPSLTNFFSEFGAVTMIEPDKIV